MSDAWNERECRHCNTTLEHDDHGTTTPDRSLSPSAKLVRRILEDADRPLTREEIATEESLACQTCLDALESLRKGGEVHRSRRCGDARKVEYTLHERSRESPEIRAESPN